MFWFHVFLFVSPEGLLKCRVGLTATSDNAMGLFQHDPGC